MDLDADAGDDAEAPLVAIAPQGDVASTEEDGQCVRLVDLLHGEFGLLVNLSVERRERLQTYQRRLQTYQFSVILIQDARIDVATEIFTRINVSGQPLLNKRVIRAKAPSVYMKAFRKENPHVDETMKTHLIDLDAFGVWEDDCDRFFRERCKVIARRLRAWIPERTIDAGGVRPRDEDYDPNDLSAGDDLGAAK